jgi:hypothetical protein
MLFLYHAGPSVCSIKVRLTLAEKDLAWDGKILNLQRGDQFQPDCPLLALSGHLFLHRACPLLGVKRTYLFALHVSAYDPKRTYRV